MWDLRDLSKRNSARSSGISSPALLSGEQVAAIVGGLLLHEQVEQQRQRLGAVDNITEGSSRWRDASRREALHGY